MGEARAMRLAMLLAVGALSACVEPAKQKASEPSSCQVSAVVDGDTVNLSCDGGAVFTARLTGFDAPETAKASCPAERAAGLRARHALSRLVNSGPVTAARPTGGESEGRPLIALEIGGLDVARAMIAEGHAVAFDGVTYPDWCERL
ncbi:MAG: thermonuclease family protein [Tabrizicola sp.]|nr:thermonuclease family protein [Tabrizicola sp.]